MKTYEIKYEPIGDIKKWNIYFFDENGKQETKEFWSYTGENEPIEGQQSRRGYIKK